MKYTLLIIYYNIYILSIFSENLIKPKLCIDCKFFIKDFFTSSKFGKCSLFPRDSIEEYNKYFLVNGKKNNKNIDNYFCSTAREFDNMCGKEGKLHEKM